MNRFRAAGYHLFISALLAVCSATLVFGLWYPSYLSYASGVTAIFFILLAVDVTLGPLITLIIFNTQKKELKRDLAIIGLIQLAALVYGMNTVFVARPVFVAYNNQRFDLVFANEIAEKNLQRATRPEFKSLPVLGPIVIASPLPSDPKIVEEIVYGAIAGGDDVQLLPQYYLPYMDQQKSILQAIMPLEDLKNHNKDAHAEVDALIAKYSAKNQKVGFLPLKGKINDLTVVLSRTNGEVLEYSKLQPWTHYVPQYVPLKRK